MQHTIDTLDRIDAALDAHAIDRYSDAEPFDDWLHELALTGATSTDPRESAVIR